MTVGGRVGGVLERESEIDGVLRAVDDVMRELTVVGVNAVDQGREKRDGNSIGTSGSNSEREKGSMRQDLLHVGAWESHSSSNSSRTSGSSRRASRARSGKAKRC